jgi:hypothetical protein
MKKIIAALGIFLLTFAIFLSSCKSTGRLCPAYPPTPRNSAIIYQNNNNLAVVSGEKDLRF